MSYISAVEKLQEYQKKEHQRANLLQVGDIVIWEGQECICEGMETHRYMDEPVFRIKCRLTELITVRTPWPRNIFCYLDEFNERCSDFPNDTYNKTLKELLEWK